MKGRVEIRIAGEGGQGVILAGIILAEAAAVWQGLNATQSQSYGPESRGGASRAEVIIDEEEIDYPRVRQPHVLLALSQEALDKCLPDVRDGGVVIVDQDRVVPPACPRRRLIEAPITRLAREKLGRAIVANMVALGVLARVSGVVTLEALRSAVAHRAPSGTEEVNLRALELGYHAPVREVSD